MDDGRRTAFQVGEAGGDQLAGNQTDGPGFADGEAMADQHRLDLIVIGLLRIQRRGDDAARRRTGVHFRAINIKLGIGRQFDDQLGFPGVLLLLPFFLLLLSFFLFLLLVHLLFFFAFSFFAFFGFFLFLNDHWATRATATRVIVAHMAVVPW